MTIFIFYINYTSISTWYSQQSFVIRSWRHARCFLWRELNSKTFMRPIFHQRRWRFITSRIVIWQWPDMIAWSYEVGRYALCRLCGSDGWRYWCALSCYGDSYRNCVGRNHSEPFPRGTRLARNTVRSWHWTLSLSFRLMGQTIVCTTPSVLQMSKKETMN